MPHAPRVTKKDVIVAELRRRITEGELERGARIPQYELAKQFATSITPVREALRELEAEGLLDGSPHRGVRVASAHLDKVKAVYIVRRLLEPYVMQRATLRVSRKDTDNAARLNAALSDAYAHDEKAKVNVLNREFHFGFYNKVGIPALTGLVKELWLGFPWDILQVIPGRAERSFIEHNMLLDAVRTGDLPQVASVTEEHIVNGFEALRDYLDPTAENHGDPFDLDND